MSHIDIQELFDESRFPSGWKLLLVLLYAPIGVALLLSRLLICFLIWLLATLLPDFQVLRTFLNRAIFFALGIIIKICPNGEKRDEQTRIVVANSISAIDDFVLTTVSNTVMPTTTNLPESLKSALGLRKMDMSNKDSLIADIKQFLPTSKNGVALQPEFSTTNSRKALLKFNTWPFSIEPAVQPVVLTASRPELINIRLTSVASTWWTDIMWFMFVPYTIFTVKFLHVKRNTEADILVREVEKDIARVLKIETSSHTVSDKTEFEKRYILEKIHNRGPQNTTGNGSPIVASAEMQRMARQVSEVLPLVPQNVILRDLLKTRNVDITIANFLDGVVTYTPEPTASTSTPGSSRASINSTSKGSVSLKKSKNDVYLTFAERKQKMIVEARERYMLKHGLKNC
ncbi:ancient ubiquitous protein 1-like [Trichogramma pretiosum]|uniref:ancient ubiquitous protein 1-like n=1 Tax=Trichogramma pretiosum TaxID=7493 RepID=UPI0006C9958B|nr:ancient ubiquitous protein 1-like [Trichogramma pretiosum]XP_023315713.1 ancient ubiquitous protein 1-like [Trichogramma pretiosum]XP_023315714.1 ancient ubiquitous protein 1-like [Trichogramma pretiosum]XP_023315715.1 ancient ubiquitous protein 1-like [Trichogramma pretiosum]